MALAEQEIKLKARLLLACRQEGHDCAAAVLQQRWLVRLGPAQDPRADDWHQRYGGPRLQHVPNRSTRMPLTLKYPRI